MKSAAEQLEEEKKLLELAELQARPPVFTRHRLPIESVHKYGDDSIDVKDGDRSEVEEIFNGALGVIDQSELLVCELPTSQPPGAAGDSLPDSKRGRTHTEAAENLGAEMCDYDQELRHIARAAQGKRRYCEPEARRDFPEFRLWKRIDDSHLSQKRKQELFASPFQGFGNREGRFQLIGELTGMSAARAYDYYKARPGRKKRAERSK